MEAENKTLVFEEMERMKLEVEHEKADIQVKKLYSDFHIYL